MRQLAAFGLAILLIPSDFEELLVLLHRIVPISDGRTLGTLQVDGIAAVISGRASLMGGRGSVIGTLFGVFILVMIRNGMNLPGVSLFWQGTAIGVIILAAVLVEKLLAGRTR